MKASRIARSSLSETSPKSGDGPSNLHISWDELHAGLGGQLGGCPSISCGSHIEKSPARLCSSVPDRTVAFGVESPAKPSRMRREPSSTTSVSSSARRDDGELNAEDVDPRTGVWGLAGPAGPEGDDEWPAPDRMLETVRCASAGPVVVDDMAHIPGL